MAVQASRSGRNVIERLREEGEIRALDQRGSSTGRIRGLYRPKVYRLTLEGNSNNNAVGSESANSSQEEKQTTYDIEQITVKQQIGEGGYGIVFSAALISMSQSERKICLKQSILTEDKNTDAALIREAENIHALEQDGYHDNIIRFLFCCTEINGDKQVFMGLEFFNGDDLSTCIQSIHQDEEAQSRFTYKQQIEIIKGVMNAVRHMQNCSIIHCDLKPRNVMFNLKNHSLKVIDFGCAVQFKSISKTPRHWGGTAEYMPLEMIHTGDVYVSKTDIYGVGALMYRVITFEKPWHHLQDMQTVRQNLNCNHADAKQVIKRMLESYETTALEDGNEMLTDLQLRICEDSDHFQDSPDLCRLVADMLHFEFHKRPDTDDIIQKVMDLDSKVVKRTNRASTASLRSGPSYEANMNVEHHLLSESKETTPYAPLVVKHYEHPDAESGMENAPQQALDTGNLDDDEEDQPVFDNSSHSADDGEERRAGN